MKRPSSSPKATDLVAPSTSARMSRTVQRDNQLELTLRSILHRRGLRFRIHSRAIPLTRRTVDIVFPASRVAVFLDGCFWHGCPIHGTSPKNNGAWWRNKIDANISRDRDTDTRLREAGWTVVRVWEHEELTTAADRVESEVRSGIHRRKTRP